MFLFFFIHQLALFRVSGFSGLFSVYQGGVIMNLAIVLFESKFINIIGITFTALILSELVNVIIRSFVVCCLFNCCRLVFCLLFDRVVRWRWRFRNGII